MKLITLHTCRYLFGSIATLVWPFPLFLHRFLVPRFVSIRRAYSLRGLNLRLSLEMFNSPAENIAQTCQKNNGCEQCYPPAWGTDYFAVKNQYPTTCNDEFWDGDMFCCRRIPLHFFNRDYRWMVQGTKVRRKWTVSALQSGIVCWNRQRALAFHFYEKLVLFAQANNHRKWWIGDDMLLGGFVQRELSSQDVSFGPLQTIIRSPDLMVHRSFITHFVSIKPHDGRPQLATFLATFGIRTTFGENCITISFPKTILLLLEC